MTFAIFIILVLGLFIALLNVLPLAAAYPFSFAPSVATIVGYMKAWDFMFPIHELLTLVLAYFAFEIAIWTWHTTWKIVKFIRGSSDGS